MMHFRDLGRPEPMGDEKRLDVLQARLDKVERDSQRWGIVGGVILAALSLVFVVVTMKKRPMQEMRANRYTLVDRAGAVRGYMAVTEKGPALVLLGKDSRARIMLAMNDEGLPEVTMAGVNGRDRFRVALLKDDSAELKFLDRRGRQRAWFGVDNENMAGVGFYSIVAAPLVSLGARGMTTSSLSLMRPGRKGAIHMEVAGDRGELMISGDKGYFARMQMKDMTTPSFSLETRRDNKLVLSLNDKAGPRIDLMDKDRNTRAYIGMSVEDNMNVTVQDNEGNATVLGTKRIVIGKDQSLVWSAP